MEPDQETGAGDPPLAEDVDPHELAAEVRAELSSLSRPVAGAVAGRLVATGQLLDVDPDQALAHAFVARRLAPRIAAVREAVGLAAYQAGEWQTAIGEMRAYHRMTGKLTHLAVIADCERALGRPERAIDLYRTADRDQLEPADLVELLIVAAGARMDLGQPAAAAAMLQVRELAAGTVEPWAARLRYAYADALLAAGRRDEAREWFARAAELDEDLATDAAERLLELDGIVLDDDDEDEEDEHDVPVNRAVPLDPFAAAPAAEPVRGDVPAEDLDDDPDGDGLDHEDLDDEDDEDDDLDDEDLDDEDDFDDEGSDADEDGDDEDPDGQPVAPRAAEGPVSSGGQA